MVTSNSLCRSALFWVKNALADVSMASIAALGLEKSAEIITDGGFVKMGVADQVGKELQKNGIEYEVFDGVNPNPTVSNVNAGLAKLKPCRCRLHRVAGRRFVARLCQRVALVATNGGKIEDYEGVDKSKKPQLPLIAINTTAGTASEMTRFTIITDETRHVKMAIVDKNVTALLSVNDPSLMEGMPAPLTAATGMDALTHAVEAYVSTAASPITDALRSESN